MKYTSFLLWFLMMITTRSFTCALSDSTGKTLFPKLAEKIGLKMPKLKANEFEIRVWNRQALRYGEAQMAYVLRRTAKKFTIVKYTINSDQHGFQFAKRLKPTVHITPLLWERLLKRNILILPNLSVVLEQLYREPEPTPIDTIQTGMQADGSFTIKGRKTRRIRTIVSDGEGYSFEIISAYGYRVYRYSNPDVYLRDNPQSKELQNVIGTLNDLSIVFRSDKSGRDQAKAINED